MKSYTNPFYRSRHHHFYLVNQNMLSKHKKILDYGCGNGRFIGKINSKGKSLYGYDVDDERIKEAKQKYPHVNFIKGKVGQVLPFKNKSLDLVFALHVLEHVDSEKNMIKEINRVLQKDGSLILASPYKGLFSWADAANIRYRFPKFHQWIVETFLGKKVYREKYLKPKANKMFYDTSTNRNWHKHYQEKEILKLLKNDFKVIKFYKYGLLLPFLLTMHNIFRFVFKNSNPILDKIIWWDNNLRAGKFSYNFFLIARKR